MINQPVNYAYDDISQATEVEIKPQKRRKWPLIVGTIILVSMVVVAGSAVIFYKNSLNPANPQDGQPIVFEVKSGELVDQIAEGLEVKGLIKNKTAFSVYARLEAVGDKLQMGTFLLKPNMSVAQIVEALTSGKTKQMAITFYPGAALNFKNTATDTTPSHREALAKAGYETQEIDQAFSKKQNHQFLKQFPEAKSLEGLILGDTYVFGLNTPIDQVLAMTFDHYQQVFDREELVTGFKAQKLTPYQGVILASIVEREASNTDYETKRKIAQVFLKRLREDIQLGSDVTYQYASRLAGTDNDLYIDSPYNTRKYSGLPPSPISSPSVDSLKAVVHPADTNYLYFVAGDDEVTYFATTDAEHEANVRQHCKIKCSVM